MSDHEHCWHAEGGMKAIASMFGGGPGPAHVCCHCGIMRMPPKVKPEDIPAGHGPFSIHTRADLEPVATPSETP